MAAKKYITLALAGKFPLLEFRIPSSDGLHGRFMNVDEFY